MPIRNIVIKKFIENWPVSKEVLKLQPEVDPRIIDLLDQIYQCITANQVGSRAEYDAKCKDLADWGQFEAYVYSYVASVGQERKRTLELNKRLASRSSRRWGRSYRRWPSRWGGLPNGMRRSPASL